MADPITREELRVLLVEAEGGVVTIRHAAGHWCHALDVADVLAILDEGEARLASLRRHRAITEGLRTSEEDERTVDDLVKRKTAERGRASLSVGDVVRDPAVLRAGDRVEVAGRGPSGRYEITRREDGHGLYSGECFFGEAFIRAAGLRLISKAPTTEDGHE